MKNAGREGSAGREGNAGREGSAGREGNAGREGTSTTVMEATDCSALDMEVARIGDRIGARLFPEVWVPRETASARLGMGRQTVRGPCFGLFDTRCGQVLALIILIVIAGGVCGGLIAAVMGNRSWSDSDTKENDVVVGPMNATSGPEITPPVSVLPFAAPSGPAAVPSSSMGQGGGGLVPAVPTVSPPNRNPGFLDGGGKGGTVGPTGDSASTGPIRGGGTQGSTVRTQPADPLPPPLPPPNRNSFPSSSPICAPPFPPDVHRSSFPAPPLPPVLASPPPPSKNPPDSGPIQESGGGDVTNGSTTPRRTSSAASSGPDAPVIPGDPGDHTGSWTVGPGIGIRYPVEQGAGHGIRIRATGSGREELGRDADFWALAARAVVAKRRARKGWAGARVRWLGRTVRREVGDTGASESTHFSKQFFSLPN